METKGKGAVSSSHQYEASFLDQSADIVWGIVKNLQFDILCPTWITSVNWTEGEPGKVGSIVTFEYRDGSRWQFCVSEISDFRRAIIFELYEANPPSPAAAILNKITVYKETICNKSFLIWESMFSNDASTDIILDTKYKKVEALTNMARYFQTA